MMTKNMQNRIQLYMKTGKILRKFIFIHRMNIIILDIEDIIGDFTLAYHSTTVTHPGIIIGTIIIGGIGTIQLIA